MLQKDEAYERAMEEAKELRKKLGRAQMEMVEKDNKIEAMEEEAERLKQENVLLQNRLIEMDSTVEKIKKHNLLVDELNSEFYGLNV